LNKVVESELLYEKEELTPVEELLIMMDIRHGIIVDSELALLGNMEDESEYEAINDHRKELLYVQVSNFDEKRGDNFDVLDNTGCLIIREKVIATGILLNKGETEGYIFILSDNSIDDALDSFFGDKETVPVCVIYRDGKLYTNSKELEYEYDESIDIELCQYAYYKLRYRNRMYAAYILNIKNAIYTFSRLER
jgi:hypothetical protein